LDGRGIVGGNDPTIHRRAGHPAREGPAVKRAYKLRAYPTRPQEGRTVRLLADHCELYNAALAERREAWRLGKINIAYRDQSAQLKEIRAADPGGQGRHSFTAQQQTLRRLNAVFAAYFQRVRNVETSQRQAGRNGQELKKRKVGYPRFKPPQRFDQVLFVAGDGASWEPADTGRWAHATLQAVGRVKVRQHRPVVGRVKTMQLKREHRRWYVIVVTETEPAPLPPTGRSVGIDLGVARFLTTSDGEVVANPRFLDAAQRRLADLQRRKERTRPGSGNRRRTRQALVKEWRRVRNRRRDFHHKTARELIGTCDILALEDLRVAAMTATASGTIEHPGRNVAAKAGLNRSILDAGWSQFTRILVAKAESAGRRVVLVHPASTSIDCHTCGARCTRPRQDTVVCLTHGELDADLNRGPQHRHQGRAGLWSSLRGLSSCRPWSAEQSPPDSRPSPAPGYPRGQRPTERAMRMRMTSLVPSPISRTLASR
jgi:putative transposase